MTLSPEQKAELIQLENVVKGEMKQLNEIFTDATLDPKIETSSDIIKIGLKFRTQNSEFVNASRLIDGFDDITEHHKKQYQILRNIRNACHDLANDKKFLRDADEKKVPISDEFLREKVDFFDRYLTALSHHMGNPTNEATTSPQNDNQTKKPSTSKTTLSAEQKQELLGKRGALESEIDQLKRTLELRRSKFIKKEELKKIVENFENKIQTFQDVNSLFSANFDNITERHQASRELADAFHELEENAKQLTIESKFLTAKKSAVIAYLNALEPHLPKPEHGASRSDDLMLSTDELKEIASSLPNTQVKLSENGHVSITVPIPDVELLYHGPDGTILQKDNGKRIHHTKNGTVITDKNGEVISDTTQLQSSNKHSTDPKSTSTQAPKINHPQNSSTNPTTAPTSADQQSNTVKIQKIIDAIQEARINRRGGDSNKLAKFLKFIGKPTRFLKKQVSIAFIQKLTRLQKGNKETEISHEDMSKLLDEFAQLQKNIEVNRNKHSKNVAVKYLSTESPEKVALVWDPAKNKKGVLKEEIREVAVRRMYDPEHRAQDKANTALQEGVERHQKKMTPKPKKS